MIKDKKNILNNILLLKVIFYLFPFFKILLKTDIKELELIKQ